MRIRQLTIIFFFLCLYVSVKAQGVGEHHNNDIYYYLSRLAAKGILKFDDQIRPLSRMYLETCLDSVAAKKNELSKIELAELQFYQRDFTDRKVLESTNDQTKNSFFKNDPWQRWRAISINAKDFIMRVDPILNGGYIAGSGRAVKAYGSGFRLYGYAGKHWSFHMSYNDFTESGSGIDTIQQNSSATGGRGRIASNKKSYNYSELRGAITYAWKNGTISFGKDYLLWGYGENGRIVLSDKAPSFPQIRLDYQPFSWLKFNYTHAWLQSGIIDSSRIYNTGVTPFGGRRDIYIQKFLAIHSLQFTPTKGLDIHIGESMVYSDRLDVGYLFPINVFKIYDQISNNDNINAGGNGQLFLQISSRNHIKKSHIYGSLFIDEIRLGSLFNRNKSRNQIGYTLGMNITDIGLPYLTLGAEYTRVNPFVYRNLIPAQNYTHDDFLMGDWMGANSDRITFTARYTPIPRLRLLFRYEAIRKGGAGTLDQQYFQEPQPPFLFDFQYRRNIMYAEAVYNWIPGLQLFSNFTNSTQTNLPSNNRIELGFRFGR